MLLVVLFTALLTLTTVLAVLLWHHRRQHLILAKQTAQPLQPASCTPPIGTVTSIQAVQEELREILEQQKVLFDNIPSGLVFSADGLIRQINTSFANMVGASAEQLIGHSAEFLFGNPQAQDAFNARVVPLLDEGHRVLEEGIFRRFDGSAFHGRVTGRRVSVSSFVRATIWVLEDVTERKQLEAHLEDQANFQSALIDTIPYPVFYKGVDARFLGVNRAYEQSMGVSRDALVGKRVLDLDYLSAADRSAYQQEDEAIIDSIGRSQREMMIPFADGREHETLYFVSGFARADGSPAGLVGTFVDISEQKKRRTGDCAGRPKHAASQRGC